VIYLVVIELVDYVSAHTRVEGMILIGMIGGNEQGSMEITDATGKMAVVITGPVVHLFGRVIAVKEFAIVSMALVYAM